MKLTGAEDGAPGERGREPGCDVGCWVDECLFFVILREVSVPLASEALGDPNRFRGCEAMPFFKGFVYLGRPEGVLAPLDDAADSFLFLSSSAFRSSSLARSSSLSSEL